MSICRQAVHADVQKLHFVHADVQKVRDLSLTKFAPRMFENVQLGVQRLISSSSTKNVTNTFKESMLCIKISGGIGGVERLGFYFLNLIT